MSDIKIMDKTMLKGLSIFGNAVDRVVKAGMDCVVTEESTADGKDDLGAYASSTQTLREQWKDQNGGAHDKMVVSMEVRNYADLDLAAVHVSASSPMQDGAFMPEGAVRLEFDSIPDMTGLLAHYMYCDWWSNPHFGTDLTQLPPRTQMLLWQTKSGEYGCVLPLVSGGYLCDLNSRTGKPGADLTSRDGGQNRCDATAFVVGLGDDPYELVRRCFTAGMTASGRPGRLRWEKQYPEIFDYIGWCTWDALYGAVNEKDILLQLKAFKKAKFPMRFLLIDDGWSPTKDGQLSEFDIDRKKFPRGLKPLVDDANEKYGFWWTGMWHTFTGYWGGVHHECAVYTDTKESLFDSKKGTRIPYPALGKGVGFWDKWHSWMRSQGVSFVKVDNQGSLHHHTSGSMKTGDAYKGEQYALQASVDLNLNGGLLNCMCMNAENLWHWVNSNVSRASDDFCPGSARTSANHARQNCYNSLMYGNVCWPDWDMWWSVHPRAKFHAAMRAISGGPVYTSDKVGNFDTEVLWPLVFSDGRLLRCDEPGVPTRDCLFADPKANPVPIKVWNMVGETGMLGAFYGTDGEFTVKGAIRPSDVEGIEGDRFAVREFFSGETRVLELDEAWEFELDVENGQKLWSVVPIEEGVAILGLANKYVSPAAVEAEFRDEDSIAIELYEGGDFMAWCENKPKAVTVDGEKAKSTYENGWLTVKCKPGKQVVVAIAL